MVQKTLIELDASTVKKISWLLFRVQFMNIKILAYKSDRNNNVRSMLSKYKKIPN